MAETQTAAFGSCAREASALQLALVRTAVAINVLVVGFWVVEVSAGSALTIAPAALLAGVPLLARARPGVFRAAAGLIAIGYLAAVPVLLYYALGFLPSGILLALSAMTPAREPPAARRRRLIRALHVALTLTATLAVGLVLLAALR